MQHLLIRVNGWIKYNQFESLSIASVGEIIHYIQSMYKKAENIRTEYQIPSRDWGPVGGYDVRSISTKAPYRDEFISEIQIPYHFIREGYISSSVNYLAIFQYQNGQSMGLYLPLFNPTEI